jgi:gas vesicle protein
MDAATWGVVGTLLGAVVGALASVLTTLITGWNTRKLQSHADSLSRLERSREFQRANLLDLQEALAQNMRLVARAHLEDLDHYRETPDAKFRPLLSESLDQELSESNRRLSLLTERLAHDQLRKSIKDLRDGFGRVLVARSAAESDSAFRAVVSGFEKPMEELGAVLRSYY